MINKENFPDSPIGDEPVWITKQLGDFNYNEVEFSKSLLDEDEEYFYDENGVRRRKKGITELSSIDVEEISLVSKPATRKKFTVIKSEGDDKEMDNFYFPTVERAIFGFNQDDLSMVSDEDIYEIEKSRPDDKFPSLTRQFNFNKARLERAYEEYAVEGRLVWWTQVNY